MAISANYTPWFLSVEIRCLLHILAFFVRWFSVFSVGFRCLSVEFPYFQRWFLVRAVGVPQLRFVRWIRCLFNIKVFLSVGFDVNPKCFCPLDSVDFRWIPRFVRWTSGFYSTGFWPLEFPRRLCPLDSMFIHYMSVFVRWVSFFFPSGLCFCPLKSAGCPLNSRFA